MTDFQKGAEDVLATRSAVRFLGLEIVLESEVLREEGGEGSSPPLPKSFLIL